MTRVIMNGCNGKMGQCITGICKDDPDIEIVAGIDLYDGIRNDYPVFHHIGECGVAADVIIDFSNASAVDELLDYCEVTHVPVVLCTTGLSEKQLERMEKVSKSVAVLKSANMSLGVNTLMELLKKAALVFAPAGFDMEIVEKHHNQKVDAPSGTALALADSMNEALDNAYEYKYDRSQERKKRDKYEIGISAVFQGESWKNAFSADFLGGIFNIVMLIVTFCLVDMFDTLGTVYGTASQAGMLDENGDPIRLEKAMMSDSVATVCGAVFGTSTVTTFVESSAGVAAGGRTGLTSLVTSLCFIVCLFLTPLASIIPSCATAPALIFVGVLMMKNFSKVDMDDIASAVPAFLAMVLMILTYSISNGIGLGCIAYTIITLCTGKYGKKDIMVTVIALLFAIKFAFVTM